jgi:MYXO-CTERM domain-containing protein
LSGFILGTTTDDGASWTNSLAALCGIRGPLACTPGTGAAACANQWGPLRADTFQCDASGDGGAGTSSGGVSGVGTGSRGGCGCRATPSSGGAFALFVIALALGAARRRRSAG